MSYHDDSRLARTLHEWPQTCKDGGFGGGRSRRDRAAHWGGGALSGISFEDRVEWTKDVLVVCWSTEPSELSLIQQAARLAACCGARARALLLDTGNANVSAPALLRQAGADRVTVLNARQVADDLLLARELAVLCRELRPGTVRCNIWRA